MYHKPYIRSLYAYSKQLLDLLYPQSSLWPSAGWHLCPLRSLWGSELQVCHSIYFFEISVIIEQVLLQWSAYLVCMYTGRFQTCGVFYQLRPAQVYVAYAYVTLVHGCWHAAVDQDITLESLFIGTKSSPWRNVFTNSWKYSSNA